MPKLTGLQATREIREQAPEVAVLILSMHDDERYLFEALKAGASGYVLKAQADTDLLAAIRAVERGEPFLTPEAQRALIKDVLERGSAGEEELTPREEEIVKLVAEANTTQGDRRDPPSLREDGRESPRKRDAKARDARPGRARPLRDPARPDRALRPTGPVCLTPAMTRPRSIRRNAGCALILLAAAQFVVVLDASIVNVALPTIGKALDFSQENLPWVVNAYVLTFGGFLLLGGRTADLLGRRRVFMGGLLLVAVASLAAGFAVHRGAADRGPRRPGARAPRSSPPPRSRSSPRPSATAPSATKRWASGAPSPAPAAPPASCSAASSPTASAGNGCSG